MVQSWKVPCRATNSSPLPSDKRRLPSRSCLLMPASSGAKRCAMAHRHIFLILDILWRGTLADVDGSYVLPHQAHGALMPHAVDAAHVLILI